MPYPSACAPQAWAAGSLCLMLQAALGLRVQDGELITQHLRLPSGLNSLALEGLPTSKGRLAIELERKSGCEEVSIDVKDLPDEPDDIA